MLTIDAKLQDSLPFSDIELCSLLSNTLENDIQVSEHIPDSNKRIIRLRVYSKNNKLCIDIPNSYKLETIFHKGMPVSKEQCIDICYRYIGLLVDFVEAENVAEYEATPKEVA